MSRRAVPKASSTAAYLAQVFRIRRLAARPRNTHVEGLHVDAGRAALHQVDYQTCSYPVTPLGAFKPVGSR